MKNTLDAVMGMNAALLVLMPSMPLQGLCQHLNIFLKAPTIKSVLSVHAQMDFEFVFCLVQKKN